MKCGFSNIAKKCPLCKSSQIIKHHYISSGVYSFNTSRCCNCGFIFMNPRFNQKTLESFYTSEYYSGKAEYSYTDERTVYEYSSYVWDARIRNIRKFANSGNFLDIGCAFGGFLSRASKYYNVYGIEVSEYSSSYARRHFGINVHTGTIESSKFKKEMFSVITMIEMIEHISDPVSMLRKCYNLLRMNGVLVIQTADMDAWQAINAGETYHYYLPGHVSYFTEKSLISVLRDSGFSRFVVYRPVDFGIIPKLLKSRGDINSIPGYLKWIKISIYHMKGFFRYRGRPLTSSMVIYAFK